MLLNYIRKKIRIFGVKYKYNIFKIIIFFYSLINNYYQCNRESSAWFLAG